MKKIFTGILFPIFCVCFVLPALGLTIHPSVVELCLEPGAKSNGFYLIRNDQNDDVLVTMEPESYTGPSITNWFRPFSASFKLKPGESKTAGYQLVMPLDFKGEYIGKIFFTSVPLKGGEEGGTGIITRMGSSFYVSCRGSEILSASADHFMIRDNKISVNLKNRGNVHLRFYYDLDVFDSVGTELFTTERVPLIVLLPGETKNAAVPLVASKPLLQGRHNAVLNLYFGNIMPLTNRMRILSAFEVNQ